MILESFALLQGIIYLEPSFFRKKKDIRCANTKRRRGAFDQEDGLPWVSSHIPPTSIDCGEDDTQKTNSIGKWNVQLELDEMVLLETSRARWLCSENGNGFYINFEDNCALVKCDSHRKWNCNENGVQGCCLGRAQFKYIHKFHINTTIHPYYIHQHSKFLHLR